MKIRKAKKQIKKVVGFMAANGCDVVNCVTNPDYTGGSCVERDEDCYKIEICYTRKRYGAPVCPKSKHSDIFWKIYYNVHKENY